jgi:Sec-independent protein secretion pathway component TatC
MKLNFLKSKTVNPSIIVENTFNPSQFISAVSTVAVAGSTAAIASPGPDLIKIAILAILAMALLVIALYLIKEARKKQNLTDEQMT